MIYGIEDDEKLYRLTFSYSLAKLIVKNDSKLKITKYNYFQTGRKLDFNEIPKNGLYGICSSLKSHNNLLLRVSLDIETAKLYTSSEYRHLEEIEIQKASL